MRRRRSMANGCARRGDVSDLVHWSNLREQSRELSAELQDLRLLDRDLFVLIGDLFAVEADGAFAEFADRFAVGGGELGEDDERRDLVRAAADLEFGHLVGAFLF